MVFYEVVGTAVTEDGMVFVEGKQVWPEFELPKAAGLYPVAFLRPTPRVSFETILSEVLDWEYFARGEDGFYVAAKVSGDGVLSLAWPLARDQGATGSVVSVAPDGTGPAVSTTRVIGWRTPLAPWGSLRAVSR